MRLLDGFNLFFNPAFVIEKIFTLWGGGGGKGGDTPDYVPVRPARVTTGFGTGRADPEKGRYTYTLDPRLAAMRDIFYGAAPQFMPSQAEQDFARGVSDYGMGVFGQGQEFLNQALGVDPRQVGQQYYSDVMNLMQTDRAQEEARLASNLFRTGRTGAAVGTQGGYVNPEQFALLRARELANQQLAIQAEDLGRSRRMSDAGFATNLLTTGLGTYGSGKQTAAAPYQTMAGIFGLGTGIEQLGMQNTLGTAMAALPIHAQIQAGRQAVENANAAASGKGGGGLLGGISSLGNTMNSVFGSGWGSDLLKAGASWYTGGLSDATSMAGGVGKPGWMYSDVNLKTNIRKIGTYKNGLNKYSFTYVWGEDGVGAIAQEVQKVLPEAVRMNNGYLEVNYELIGE
jgi:hypothetical protein